MLCYRIDPIDLPAREDAAISTTATAELQLLDKTFLAILSSLRDEVTQVAGQASETILERASSYVADDARRALTNFHKLYFSEDGSARASLVEVNRNVDDLFEQAQTALARGADASTLKLQEDEEKVKARFSFSGVQKELEAIIRMDEGIRQRLVPILSNLQFEDALRQRLSHIIEAWEVMTVQLRQPEDLDVELAALEMGALTTSVAERELFYRVVVKQPPPPEAHVTDMLMFDF